MLPSALRSAASDVADSPGAVPCIYHGQGPFVAQGCEGDQGELGTKVDVQSP